MNPDLLARVPRLQLALGVLPEALQRSLYAAFQLQVRYHRPRHEVTIRVTIRADALPTLIQLVKRQPVSPASRPETANRTTFVPMFWAPPAGFNLRTRLQGPLRRTTVSVTVTARDACSPPRPPA
jgi:hypothetical protein